MKDGKLNNQLADAPKKYSLFDNILQLLLLIIILFFIVIAAHYVTKLVSSIKVNQLKDSNFKIIDTYNIAPNKSLQIVKIGARYILLSINKESTSFIMELKEEELTFIKDDIYKKDFTNIFNKIRKEKKGN